MRPLSSGCRSARSRYSRREMAGQRGRRDHSSLAPCRTGCASPDPDAGLAGLKQKADSRSCGPPDRRPIRPPSFRTLQRTCDRLRRRPAMVVLVLAAFLGTVAADLRTELAEGFGIGAVAGHQHRRDRTHVGAVTIEFDAARHHLHVVLAQAGGRAGLADQAQLEQAGCMTGNWS